MRRTDIFGIMLLAALPLACDQGPGWLGRDHGIGFDAFVDATVGLRRAAAETHDSVAFQARKQAVERRLRVTDAQLRQFVKDHGDNVQMMAAVWDSVEARLARLKAEDDSIARAHRAADSTQALPGGSPRPLPAGARQPVPAGSAPPLPAGSAQAAPKSVPRRPQPKSFY
jgi:hypothetical protein